MKKEGVKTGCAGVSLAGHDAEKLFLVIAEADKNFVLCCDGKNRPLSKPKLKRRSHLKLIKDLNLQQEDLEKLTDAKIKKLLKAVKGE